MSGRMQHHIPQSFQCGFLSCEKTRQTHVYRSDKNYISNINRVAAQRDFYSKPLSDGTKALDDLITDYEERLGRLLSELRTAGIGTVVDSSTSAEIIAHLTPRGNSVRRIFGSSVEKLVVGASEIFSDNLEVMFLLGLNEPAPNRKWDENIASAIRENKDISNALEVFSSNAGFPEAVLDRIIFFSAKEMIISGDNLILNEFKQVLTKIFSQVAGNVEEIHKKMLRGGLVAEPRKEALEKLIWKIYPAPIGGAIMPDCIALGFSKEDGMFLPYILTSMPSLVVMPLTSQKLLVGADVAQATLDLSGFNNDAAQCSDEIFIARSSCHAELSQKIGKRWKKKMDVIIQDALSRYRSGEASNNSASIPGVHNSSLSYQLTFNGRFEEKDVDSINETIRVVLIKLGEWLQLARLDGITFTSNFQDALEKTDRCFDTQAVIEYIPDYIAQGAAALLVVRNEELKVRIVMDKEYAMSLIGEDLQDAGVALHLIAAGMSLANAINHFERDLPGFLIEPVMSDNHDAVLHCAMRKAIRAYRYAYDSAGCGSDNIVEQEFSKYVVHALDASYGEISDLKQVHADDKDHPKFFDSIQCPVANILTSVARLVGHRDGMEDNSSLNLANSVNAAMAARQLTAWVEAFAHDLRRFWNREKWTQEDFYALNIHVERILWSRGIFIYPADNTQGSMILSI